MIALFPRALGGFLKVLSVDIDQKSAKMRLSAKLRKYSLNLRKFDCYVYIINRLSRNSAHHGRILDIAAFIHTATTPYIRKIRRRWLKSIQRWLHLDRIDARRRYTECHEVDTRLARSCPSMPLLSAEWM